MKKVLYSAMVVFALASCKKDYTCECVETYTYNGTSDAPTTETTIVKGVSKKIAQSASECVSYESTYIDDSGDVSVTNRDCSISK